MLASNITLSKLLSITNLHVDVHVRWSLVRLRVKFDSCLMSSRQTVKDTDLNVSVLVVESGIDMAPAMKILDVLGAIWLWGETEEGRLS